MSLQGPQKLAILFVNSAIAQILNRILYRSMKIYSSKETRGLNDYWIEASLGAINLDGSKVFLV